MWSHFLLQIGEWELTRRSRAGKDIDWPGIHLHEVRACLPLPSPSTAADLRARSLHLAVKSESEKAFCQLTLRTDCAAQSGPIKGRGRSIRKEPYLFSWCWQRYRHREQNISTGVGFAHPPSKIVGDVTISHRRTRREKDLGPFTNDVR